MLVRAMQRAGASALTAAVSIGFGASIASAQDASGAKVEEQVVGPAKQGLSYVVSPRGAHLAIVTQKGSRFVVLVDGVEGPKFDDILSLENGAKVLFSPDGTRSAYVARSGQEFVVVVDGKELMRPGNATDLNGSSPVTQLAFTSNSKHVWFLQHVHKSNQTGDDYSCIVFDGVPGIPGESIPIFSADGDHFAYIATNPRDPSQQTLVLDGKSAGYWGTDPLFTGDGKHLLVRTQVPLGPGRGQALQVLLDGKPVFKAEDATLFVAPAGELFAAAIRRSGPSGPQSFLVIDGKKIEGSESVQIPQVTFSPDGKRYAAECQTAANSHFVVVDGKKGQEYQAVSNVAFSEDSSHCTYRGLQGGKTFVVVDGEESDGCAYVQEFAFGGRGKRIGYIAAPEAASRSIVVNGTATMLNSNQVEGLSFSGDGSRCAYLVGMSNSVRLVLDGVEYKEIRVMSYRSTIESNPAKFVFSFDGKHLALFGGPAASMDASTIGLILDGKRIQLGTSFFNPTFTPGGRHLLWMVIDGATNRYGIFVDGQRCAQFDSGSLLMSYSRTWEMGDDGVLTALGQDGEKMKRIRVTPSAEASVDTLLASVPVAGAEKPVK